MSRPRPLSGFPELLPEQRIVEQAVLDRLRRTFELHGFAPVETRAVEPLDRLTRQGEVDKEVYAITRAQAEPGTPAELGLHFDLTVPFARYVLENAARLAFPFRRYQIQKVWRGERPQTGRYREFTQADVDIVDEGRLAAQHDVELPLVTLEALESLRDLGVPEVRMRVSNRKLAAGFYRGLGIADPVPVLRQMDKVDKVGPERVRHALVTELGLTPGQADRCVRLAGISAADDSFVDRVHELGADDNAELDEGLALLADVVRTANAYVGGRLVVDLSIARGLDYYTGTVYETQLVGLESWGSVSSGGRYDALAGDGRTTYPGVGLSIGVTRLLAPLFAAGLAASRPVPTAVLVAVTSEESRPAAVAVAQALRRRGVACEVAPRADRFGRQIRYADRRRIPYVWFGGPADGEVKDIRTGDQGPADPATWTPPAADLVPRVEAPDATGP